MIYILLFVVCFVLVLLENSRGTENVMKVIQPILLFLLILFFGLRATGPDYYSYQLMFDDIMSNQTVEPFFRYTMKFFRAKNISYNLYLFFIATISILIKTVVFKRHSPYFFLSILFALPLMFLGDMSQIRSTLAVATVMLAIPYCVDRDPWKFTLVFLVAVSMHISAVVFIFAYFLPSFKLRYPYLILIWIGCYIISLFLENSTIASLIDEFAKDTMVDSKFDNYLLDDNETFTSRVQYSFFGNSIKILILTLLYYSNIENKKLKLFFINAYFIGGCLFYLFGFSEIMMDRSSCFYLRMQVLSIPLALYYIKDKLLYWSLLFVFVGISYYYYYSMIYVQYADMFLPYKSIIGDFFK